MPEEQIRALIRQEIQRSDNASRFRLNPTNRHIHNNVDAPFVFQPQVAYAGFVYDDATIGNPFPKGWTVESLGTGIYRVTHNLSNLGYSVVVTAIGNPLVPSAFPGWQILQDYDAFDVLMYDTALQTNLDNSFTFLLTFVNNKSEVPPQYSQNTV